MRPHRPTARAATYLVALLLTAASSAFAQVDFAEPLDLPQGAGLRPETAAELPIAERVELAREELVARGYEELPTLAWALLASSRAEGSTELVGQALELAPNTPGVRFEAARQLRSPYEFWRSLVLLRSSFPGILWLVTAGGAALGLGILLAASFVVIIGFLRTAGLHGHALGHFAASQDPPSWPGVLIAIAALALVPLGGVGPAIVLGFAGLLAALRARPRTSVAIAAALSLMGVVLGPGLDYWSRVAVLHGRDSAVLVVWRIDHGQPLPGDRQRLAHAVEREPNDLLLRLGLAAAAKHEGDVDAARAALSWLPDSGTVSLHAYALNTLGILQLAEGDVGGSISSFEDARTMREDAAVLFNLSQAYARGVRLVERTAPFQAARTLDPDLVHRYTAFEGKNLHRFLIQGHVPLSAYLERTLRASPAAAELAHDVRLWTLGPGAASWAWLLLPVLGVVGAVLRRRSIRRCGRCERPLCERCAPKGMSGSSCVRCARLFARGANSDPRMRKLQLELDRRRRRHSAWVRASVALLVPGGARVLEGRVITGSVALLLAGMGAALVLMPELVPVPFEVGGLGKTLPLIAGCALLGPAYVWALADTRRQLKLGGSRT